MQSVGVGVELRDLDVSRAVGEVDVEQPRRGVVRCERRRQESALAAGDHGAGDVGERTAPAPLHEADPTAALDDDEAGGAGSGGHVGRAVKPPDPLQLHARLGVGGGGAEGEGGESRERHPDGEPSAHSAKENTGTSRTVRVYFPLSSVFCCWLPAWPMMSPGLIGTTWPESFTRVWGALLEMRTTNSPSGTEP